MRPVRTLIPKAPSGATTKWVREEEEEQGSEVRDVTEDVPNGADFATTTAVGQAVKTAASHAANMGSIPVRVTNPFFLEKGIDSEIKI